MNNSKNYLKSYVNVETFLVENGNKWVHRFTYLFDSIPNPIKIVILSKKYRFWPTQ